MDPEPILFGYPVQEGTLNGLGPLRAPIEVINLANYTGNDGGLVNAIRNAQVDGGENRIILAWCHSNSETGDVMDILTRNNI